jgi:hypothetical protein
VLKNQLEKIEILKKIVKNKIFRQYIMTHTRSEDGTYHINGKKYAELCGSRAQVWNKTAYKTSGNLTRRNLMRNKWGRIVSAAKHKTAKKEKRLEKNGYFAKKGEFGVVKKNDSKKNDSRKKRK